jgi:hypothetical protein
MQEYELSFLYLPPKDWPLRAEDWHDQVDKVIAYTRQTIAQDIEDKAKRYLSHWGELFDYEEGMQDGSWVDGSPINLSLDQFFVELVDVLDIVRGK